MENDEQKAAALCQGPVGVAFLEEASIHSMIPSMPASEIVKPKTTFDLLSKAVMELSPWTDFYEEVVRDLPKTGHHFLPLAQEIVRHPGAEWWFGPLDRRKQVSCQNPPHRSWELRRPVPVTTSPTEFERYSQRPTWGQLTSTLRGNTSSFLHGAEMTVGDLGPIEPPVAVYRLPVSDTARVFTVDGPHAWHWLCTTYPAEYEYGQIVPDYAAVARDWDGVHVTIAGLLTGLHVRVEGEHGWTMLWAWDAEMSVWLRWVFEAEEHLFGPGW